MNYENQASLQSMKATCQDMKHLLFQMGFQSPSIWSMNGKGITAYLDKSAITIQILLSGNIVLLRQRRNSRDELEFLTEEYITSRECLRGRLQELHQEILAAAEVK